MGQVGAVRGRVLDPPDQLQPGGDVAPLIGAAHLELDAELPMELQEVGRLEEHVAELGVRQAGLEPVLDRILGQHVRDREVLADVAQEVEQAERCRASRGCRPSAPRSVRRSRGIARAGPGSPAVLATTISRVSRLRSAEVPRDRRSCPCRPRRGPPDARRGAADGAARRSARDGRRGAMGRSDRSRYSLILAAARPGARPVRAWRRGTGRASGARRGARR